jgi:hypothetical protein
MVSMTPLAFLGECRYKVPIARRIGMWLFGKIVN